MAGLVGEVRATNIFCLDYSDIFNMVSLKIFLDNLMKYGLYEHWYEWV